MNIRFYIGSMDPAPNFEFVHVRKVKLLAGNWLERIQMFGMALVQRAVKKYNDCKCRDPKSPKPLRVCARIA